MDIFEYLILFSAQPPGCCFCMEGDGERKRLLRAWGHKFIKPVNLLKVKSHVMDPSKWGQRPHTYLSSFLEGSIAKFKGYDECNLKRGVGIDGVIV